MVVRLLLTLSGNACQYLTGIWATFDTRLPAKQQTVDQTMANSACCSLADKACKQEQSCGQSCSFRLVLPVKLRPLHEWTWQQLQWCHQPLPPPPPTIFGMPHPPTAHAHSSQSDICLLMYLTCAWMSKSSSMLSRYVCCTPHVCQEPAAAGK